MSKVTSFSGFALVLMLIVCMVDTGLTHTQSSESSEFGPRQRSLCNVFGGCSGARSIQENSGAGGGAIPKLRLFAPYTLQNQISQLNLAPIDRRSSGRATSSLAGLEHHKQAQEQRLGWPEEEQKAGLDLVMHPARLGRFVEDQKNPLTIIGRGTRLRRSE